MLRRAVLILCTLALATSAYARDWYAPYQDGLKAAKAKDWATVQQKMSEAIAALPAEAPKARPYGAIFVNYRPYYYRGIANYNLGNYREAMSDLGKTGGAGEVALGDAETFADKAKEKLGGGTPAPTPAPPPPSPGPINNPPRPVPTPGPTNPHPTPQPPAPIPSNPGEAALKQSRDHAEALLRQAEMKARSAVRANANRYDATNFGNAEALFRAATNARATARTADDWNRVADSADSAARTYDASMATARIAVLRESGKVDQAADQALSGLRTSLRDALQDYFRGNFDRSAANFKRITSGPGKDLPLLWAFQGAAIYYSYYLDGSSDTARRAEAIAAFKHARSLSSRMKTLPSKYFSPRVRRFYENNVH